MAQVSVWDKDGVEHKRETCDARECVEHLGWSLSAPEVKQAEPVELTAKQLRDALDAAGVQYKTNASKAELQGLYNQIQ